MLIPLPIPVGRMLEKTRSPTDPVSSTTLIGLSFPTRIVTIGRGSCEPEWSGTETAGLKTGHMLHATSS